MQIQPGSGGRKSCPRCGRLNPATAPRCLCGYYFQAAITPPNAVQPTPIGAVYVAQPTTMPGPTCPRCASPYVNPVGQRSSANSGIVVMLVLLGLCFWPLFALIPLALPNSSSTPFNCHTCGLNFQMTTSTGQISTKTKIFCFSAAGILLLIQIGISIANSRRQ